MRIKLEGTVYEYSHRREYEEDNVKIWHEVLVNGKGRKSDNVEYPYYLDHSPYEQIDEETFHLYCLFYNEFSRFPNREDLNTHGPLNSEILDAFVNGESHA